MYAAEPIVHEPDASVAAKPVTMPHRFVSNTGLGTCHIQGETINEHQGTMSGLFVLYRSKQDLQRRMRHVAKAGTTGRFSRRAMLVRLPSIAGYVRKSNSR